MIISGALECCLEKPSSSGGMSQSGGNMFILRLFAGMLAATAVAGPAAAAQLTVQVEGADPRQGPVLIGICTGSLDLDSCGYNQTIQQPPGNFSVVFPELPEGSYAVAAFQDTNGNNNLDRDPNGLPREPYGFSNGTGRTAPPSFKAARITVRGNVVARVRLARSPLTR
ncbi:DUF2141 domain-containing protein [Microvirga aerilata]